MKISSVFLAYRIFKIAARYCLAAMSLLQQGYAFADLNSTPSVTLGQLEALQSETLLYEAQLSRNKALSALKGSQPSPSAGITAHPLQREESPDETLPNNAFSENSVTPSMPQIVQISGKGRKLVAELELPGNQRLNVVSGTLLPGISSQIVDVSADRVTVVDGRGRTTLLPFKR
ncbi:type IV pilus biogenesis protein PilP [Erwinia pyrifoliae]|uniref:Type IV pilus biogenesis protein PilP n=1 Tax=Erwinia pyrifoliae TaxID=79967 RepID=A0ABY5X7H1_ERWPY|nr:type IV pilus biogenesis protein PilP [Erwinia pyrifoliae]UWS33249.1 type IV pilus biogenesis protein PilP [Erwinia pyrifoliae]